MQLRRAAPTLIALAALAAAAAGGEEAGKAHATRSAVEARLRAYEPTSPAEWRALGAGVDGVLVEVARDPKMETPVRARAVSALGYFPTPPSRKLLEDTVHTKASSKDAGDLLLVRKAAVALGWIGGLRVPVVLAPLLDHRDPDVRLDAALGLGLTRLAAAAEALRKRYDIEPEARVRTQIGRQLQIIEDAVAPRAPAEETRPATSQ